MKCEHDGALCEARMKKHPFDYGRFGTETASTVAIGEMIRHSHNFNIFTTFLYTPFFFTLPFTSPSQGKTQPSRTRSNGLSDPEEGKICRKKEQMTKEWRPKLS